VLRTACREGFTNFITKAGIQRRPRVVACGGRRDAYESFCTAVAQGEAAMLLVDSEAAVAEVATHLDMNYAYLDGGFPGAILSRFPVLEHENHSLPSKDIDALEPFTRYAGRAVIDAPGGPVAVFSAHLHPRSRDLRLREIEQILAWLERDIESRATFLVQGDLNHPPDTPEYAAWRDAGLVDAFASKGVGVEGTVRSNKPTVRIDYVWAHGPLAETVRECRALYEGAFRVNPEDPTSFALSDHLPVLATFGELAQP